MGRPVDIRKSKKAVSRVHRSLASVSARCFPWELKDIHRKLGKSYVSFISSAEIENVLLRNQCGTSGRPRLRLYPSERVAKQILSRKRPPTRTCFVHYDVRIFCAHYFYGIRQHPPGDLCPLLGSETSEVLLYVHTYTGGVTTSTSCSRPRKAQEDDHTRVLNAPDRMSKRTTRQIESMLHTRSLAFRRRRTPRSLVRSLARLLKVKHLQRRPRSFSRSKLGRTLSLFSRPFSSLLGNRPAPPGEGPAITRTATARRIRVGKDN